MMELTTGAVLNGTYELIDLLGRGGMGEVWRGRHLRLPKEVAIKILVPSAQSSAEAVTRFHREAEISSRLGHPNIVEILDFNTLDDGRAYIVMELLVGEDLRHRLRRGPLPTKEALEILNQVAAALLVAHRAGVVHRDLKPENIFLFRKQGVLSSELCVKVLDFGISKIQGSQTLVTRDHDVLGTPAYMSPEQATGKNQKVDGHTDQFALATIGYEMFSGKCAFAGDTLAEVVHKVVYEEVPSLAELKPELPLRITRGIDRGMAKEPSQRFSDVAAFIREISGSAEKKERPGVPGSTGAVAGGPGERPRQPTGSKAEQGLAGTVATPGLESTLAPSGLEMAPPNASVTPGLESTMASSPGLEPTLAPWEPGPAAARVPPSAGQEGPSSSMGERPAGGEGGASGQVRPGAQVQGQPTPVAPLEDTGSSSSVRWPGALVALVLGLAALAVLALFVVRITRPEHRAEDQVTSKSTARHPVADSATLASPTGARAGPDAAVGRGHKDAQATRPDRSTPSTQVRQAKVKKIVSKRKSLPPELTPEVARLLKTAQTELAKEDYRKALRLANRTLMMQREQHQAYVIMARAHCGLRDIGMVQAMLRRVPRSLHGGIWRFCRRFGIQGL